MPRRKITYPEKPWKPDPDRWRPLLDQTKEEGGKFRFPQEPVKGWQLWDWRTLKDMPQNERL